MIREPHPALEPDLRYLTAPADPEAAARMALLEQLGVVLKPDDEFDRLARALADAVNANGGMAMVNFIGPDNQFFAGLYAPPGTTIDRVMSRSDGWCPHTITRRVPFPLPDVNAWSRSQTNRVAAELGIESYLGAPILGRGSHGNLGTVCVIDSQTHRWDQADVNTIASFAQDAADLIYKRADTA